MADVLYGVTMQEQGISKIVSVKFHKADEPATAQKPHPLEEQAAADASIQNEEDRLRPREDTIVMAK
jgi:hypothetical protein